MCITCILAWQIFIITTLLGATTLKGATSNKVGVLTKGYNIDVAFMYWFIKYQIIFRLFFLPFKMGLFTIVVPKRNV